MKLLFYYKMPFEKNTQIFKCYWYNILFSSIDRKPVPAVMWLSIQDKHQFNKIDI